MKGNTKLDTMDDDRLEDTELDDCLIIDDLIGCEVTLEFLTGQKIQGTLLGYDLDGWFLTVASPYFGKEILVQRRAIGMIVPVE